MNSYVKSIIIGLSLIFIGSIVFVIGGGIIYKNYGGLDLSKGETKTLEITEEFKDINLDLITYDILIHPSNSENVKIVYTENEKVKCTISVVDSVLKITDKDTSNWLDRLFSYGEKSVNVYLPEKEYNDLIINLTTGDVKFLSTATFNNVSVEVTTGDIEGSINTKKNLTIKTTTGDVEISNVNCENLTINGTSCDVELLNVIATETFKIKITTGDVEFTACDSKFIEITSTTGDVIGSLLTGKAFTVSSTTGEKIYPENSSGGTCKVKTTTGDIKIKLV